MSIYLRKEWFGGIIGVPQTYDVYLLNKKAYQEITAYYLDKISISSTLYRELENKGIQITSNYKIFDNANSQNNCILSAPLILWLEITNECNSNCIHCFRNTGNFGESLSITNITNLINEASELGIFKITITGGEPLLHDDFNLIAHMINRTGMDFRVFTGSEIDKDRLKNTNFQLIDHLFVSLDGDRTHNNWMRGDRAFDSACRLLNHVREKWEHLKITISLTIDNNNWRRFDEIIMIAKRYRIKSILTRPLFITNRNTSLYPHMFATKFNLLNALNTIVRAANSADIEVQINKIPYFPMEKRIFYDDSESAASIWNILGIETNMDCVGGNLVMGIKHNGAVLPCGFIDQNTYPFRPFNVAEHTIKSIWNFDQNINWMRNIKPSFDCKNCNYLAKCNGGCRANSLNFGFELSDTDQYCLYSNTCLGRHFPPSESKYKNNYFDIESEQPIISKTKLSTKCGWSTYDT